MSSAAPLDAFEQHPDDFKLVLSRRYDSFTYIDDPDLIAYNIAFDFQASANRLLDQDRPINDNHRPNIFMFVGLMSSLLTTPPGRNYKNSRFQPERQHL